MNNQPDRSGRVLLVDCTDAAGEMLKSIERGQLDPAMVETRAVDACKRLFGQVNGPGDVLWALQIDVARQVLEAGGLTANELAEWTAVQRRRETDVDAAE